MLKEILRDQIRLEIMDNSGIHGRLMDLSLKAIINLLNWDGELMKKISPTMQFSIDKGVNLLFI